MSNGIKCLELNSGDARKLLASKAHLGNTNCNYQMAQYVIVLKSNRNLRSKPIVHTIVATNPQKTQFLHTLHISAFFGCSPTEWRLV